VKISVLFTTALIVGFGHQASAAPPKTITATDANRPITLQIGQEVVLTLESKRSTGYSWFLAESKDPVLIRLDKGTYHEGRAVPGTGGIETWKFRAARSGVETLKLEYRRPWEKKVLPAKTIIFDITVR
jgi:inhibitor of cysteine peptidase